MIDFVSTLGVKDLVTGHGIIEDTSLGDLLGLEALVFREVLSVVVTEMVVGDDRGEAETGSNEEVTHDGLEAGLARLEVSTGN